MIHVLWYEDNFRSRMSPSYGGRDFLKYLIQSMYVY